MRAARARLLAIAACAALLGACGAERLEIPPDEVRPGERTQRLRYPKAGLSVSLPAQRSASRRPSPGVFRMPIGQAVIAVYAYPRKEQLPEGAEQLALARRRLVAEVRSRDPRFRLTRSRTTRVAGAPAVELLGTQTLSRSRVRTRSVHVYKGRAEYVFELLAPRPSYASTDRNAFGPMLRTARLSGRVQAPAPRGG